MIGEVHPKLSPNKYGPINFPLSVRRIKFALSTHPSFRDLGSHDNPHYSSHGVTCKLGVNLHVFLIILPPSREPGNQVARHQCRYRNKEHGVPCHCVQGDTIHTIFGYESKLEVLKMQLKAIGNRTVTLVPNLGYLLRN